MSITGVMAKAWMSQEITGAPMPEEDRVRVGVASHLAHYAG